MGVGSLDLGTVRAVLGPLLSQAVGAWQTQPWDEELGFPQEKTWVFPMESCSCEPSSAPLFPMATDNLWHNPEKTGGFHWDGLISEVCFGVLGVLLVFFGWGDSEQTLPSAMEIIHWVSQHCEVTWAVSPLAS